MKTPRVVRTISFRLMLLYACLFAASTALLFGFVYWIATATLRDQLRASVQSEIASLEAETPAGASGEFARQIDRRLSQGARPFLYRLTDPSGRRIAGNLAIKPRLVGWQTIPYAFAAPVTSLRAMRPITCC